jgi:hypothetical protein
VIGGYTPNAKHFHALIFGYYEGSRLFYAARTRNGFTPRLREKFPEATQTGGSAVSLRKSA